jgi:DNA (cytosine-5)-methyltransferase 1
VLHGLDLFSGIGGISLALQPRVRTVCYVEIEPHCQRVLRERIAEGRLDDAPIWDDVCSFDPSPWRGLVDIVAGGFPCQDISTAGRGAGLAGERSGLFSEIVRVAGALRPRFIFLENVAAITAPGRGGWDVVGALAALGYDARWGVLSAFDVGAPHLRERWWCLAHAESAGQQTWGSNGVGARRRGAWSLRAPAYRGGERRTLADAEGQSKRAGLRADRPGGERGRRPGDGGGAGSPQREGPQAEWAQPAVAGGDFWAIEPDVGRVADGVPARVDRLRGLGNSVVPACAREAFRRLLTGE